LHGFACWISITVQVLDGPPGFTTRRLSTFLLIPVGTTGRDLQPGPRLFRKSKIQRPIEPDRHARSLSPSLFYTLQVVGGAFERAVDVRQSLGGISLHEPREFPAGPCIVVQRVQGHREGRRNDNLSCPSFAQNIAILPKGMAARLAAGDWQATM
jgi:hypothetical protein